MPNLLINGTDVDYVEAGAGPTLLLLHGQLCDQRFWTPQLDGLSAAYRVVAPSLRHYWPGRCDERSRTFTTHQHALDIGFFIKALETGPVHLLGHSRGGYVALRVAQLFPDRVRSLVLAEPGGPIDLSANPGRDEVKAGQAPTQTPFERVLPRIVQHIKAGEVEAGLTLMYETITGRGAWAMASKAFRTMARDNAATLLAQAVYEPRRDPITLAQIQRIAAPTLLIGGSDTLAPFPQILAQLASALRDVRRVELPGAGHSMTVYQAAAFNAAVIDFLSKR